MSSLKDRLLCVWRKVLDVESVEPEDDFFSLGGDSVAVMLLLTSLEEDLGIMADAGLVYDAPTYGAMLQALEAMTAADHRAAS